MTDSAFPTKVSYNKDDVRREAAQETYAGGAVVQVVIDQVKPITAPTKGKGPGEDLIFQMRLSVLDPDDGTTRMKPNLWNRSLLPIKHPEFMDTHVPPNWAMGFWTEFCRAFIPERHPDKPRNVGGQWYFKGKKIERGEIKGITEELTDALLAEVERQVACQGTDLVNSVAFATIKLSETETGTYTNLSRMRPELSEDEELTAHGDLKEKGAASKGNGKKGRARPAKKKSRRRS